MGNARMAWQGLNTMMGRNQKQHSIQCPDSASFATELNQFYARFNDDHLNELWTPIEHSDFLPIRIEEQNVGKVLMKVKPQKASGPDGIKGKVLRECASQLKGVLTQLFQLSLDFNVVPRAWKESTIIPLPKKAHAKALEDYRPVALTSVLCKCME